MSHHESQYQPGRYQPMESPTVVQGAYQSRQAATARKNRNRVLVLAGGLLVIVAGCCMGAALLSQGNDDKGKGKITPSTAPVVAAPTPTAAGAAGGSAKPKPAPKPAPTIGDGTWVVGEDFPAGRYRVIEPVQGTCYWQISKANTNGSSIVANDIVTGGRPTVTLKKGQEFRADCGTWRKVG
jgi:hypothetical protein